MKTTNSYTFEIIIIYTCYTLYDCYNYTLRCRFLCFLIIAATLLENALVQLQLDDVHAINHWSWCDKDYESIMQKGKSTANKHTGMHQPSCVHCTDRLLSWFENPRSVVSEAWPLIHLGAARGQLVVVQKHQHSRVLKSTIDRIEIKVNHDVNRFRFQSLSTLSMNQLSKLILHLV